MGSDLFIRPAARRSVAGSGGLVLALAALIGMLIGSQVVSAAPAVASAVPVVAPASIASDCSVDVSDHLQWWLQHLPPDSTWTPPSGACYLINEGILLRTVNGLTIDGGRFENSNPMNPNPFFWLAGTYPESLERVPSQNVTLENMVIRGSHVNGSGYTANGAFVRSDGVINLTIANDNVANVAGDAVNLEPNRDGGVILNPSQNVTVSNLAVDGTGRQGIAPVSVDGAVFTNVHLRNVGFNAYDFEADQGNEGAENVVVNGCDGRIGVNISSNAYFTGPITFENCTAALTQSIAVTVRSTSGSREHGPLVFDHDSWRCRAPTIRSCFWLGNAANLLVENSTISFTSPGTVYRVGFDSNATFANDTVSGYGSRGITSPADGHVTVSGGTWTRHL